jgi:phosphatidate cytidylyltransferase
VNTSGSEEALPSKETQRIISAAVLAPIPVAAVWFGMPWLALLTIIASAVMGWEWARLCHRGRVWPGGLPLIVAVVMAVAVAATLEITAAAAVIIAGAAIVYLIARERREAAPLWLVLGALWIAVPCVLLLWLAQSEQGGRLTLLWLLAVVWATDIGAYEIGRRVGGPRLAPRWSPGKTWAGLMGGAACAAIAGWTIGRLLALGTVWPLVLASAGLAIVSQFGDLAESVAKRRFGVKDSSGLIPGHGGLLDRLDGLLAAIPAVAALTVLGGGVLAWR